MRKFLVLVLSSILLGTLITPVSAFDQRRVWDINKLSEITDPNLMRVVFGYYPVQSVNDDFSFTVEIDGPNPYRLFQVLLSPCSSDTSPDVNFQACIEGVAVRKVGTTTWSSGSVSPVSLGEPTKTLKGKAGNLVVGKPVAAEKEIYRPAGDRASLWEMPTAPHSKGSTYLVRAVLSGESFPSSASADYVPQRRFSMELLPISATKSGTVINQDEFRIEEFPKDYEYKLRLRLGVFAKSISGWFFGRIQDQTIDLNVPTGYFEMIGTPARVPMGVTDVIKKSQIPQRLLEICAKLSTDINCDGNTANNYGRATLYAPDDGANPEILSEYESVPGGVKTAASLSFWNIKSYGATSLSGGLSKESCSVQIAGQAGNGFQGIVSSNASMYQRTPPTWDEANKAFTFKVASPHLDEFGVENKGFYTLYLPISQANCRWGSDATLPQAQVQIVNQNGTSSITTAIATQENGMLRFNISGFTYSAPIIRIRMGQGEFKPGQRAPIKTISGPKKVVLICVKGKTTKQIVAVKPKCPAGFKKK
jgi:hypothetical protein